MEALYNVCPGTGIVSSSSSYRSLSYVCTMAKTRTNYIVYYTHDWAILYTRLDTSLMHDANHKNERESVVALARFGENIHWGDCAFCVKQARSR